MNVLYVTLELSEEKVEERMDANLLDVTISDLHNLTYDKYRKKIDKVSEKVKGKLVVKEYPTSCAGSANFRHLLNELRIKKNFVPDVVYVDYLNICSSSRLKNNGSVGSYFYVKAIVEELRGLAVEFNVAMVSATQTNKDGYSSDLDITNTSESMGIAHTADFVIGIVFVEELNQYMFIQLKSRYSDIGYYKKFMVGVDKSKMRLYNVEQSAQEDIVKDTPVFDNTRSGDDFGTKSKLDKAVFEGFK